MQTLNRIVMIFMVWRNETESKALKFKGTKMIPIDLAQKKLSEKKKKNQMSALEKSSF